MRAWQQVKYRIDPSARGQADVVCPSQLAAKRQTASVNYHPPRCAGQDLADTEIWSNTAETMIGLCSYLAISGGAARATSRLIAPPFILSSVYLAFALTPALSSTVTRERSCSSRLSVDPKVVTTTVISYSDQQIELVQGRVMTIEIS